MYPAIHLCLPNTLLCSPDPAFTYLPTWSLHVSVEREQLACRSNRDKIYGETSARHKHICIYT
jgi:hypothetical protein